MCVHDITPSSRDEFHKEQSSYIEEVYNATNCICHIFESLFSLEIVDRAFQPLIVSHTKAGRPPCYLIVVQSFITSLK